MRSEWEMAGVQAALSRATEERDEARAEVRRLRRALLRPMQWIASASPSQMTREQMQNTAGEALRRAALTPKPKRAAKATLLDRVRAAMPGPEEMVGRERKRAAKAKRNGVTCGACGEWVPDAKESEHFSNSECRQPKRAAKAQRRKR